MAKNYLTEDALLKLREELKYLTESGRRQAAEKIKQAIEDGGYEDNAVYDLELEKQRLLEKKISELEGVVSTAEVIKPNSAIVQKGHIDLGATVIVEADGEKDEFRIVGSYEANPIKNLISNESPVGQALLGSKVGDVIEVTTPVVKVKYKVLDVRYE